MIKCVWRAYAKPENAGAVEHFMQTLMLPGFAFLAGAGHLGTELLRRPIGDEIEFAWEIKFERAENIAPLRSELSGPVSVPVAAQRLLSRWDSGLDFYEYAQIPALPRAA